MRNYFVFGVWFLLVWATCVPQRSVAVDLLVVGLYGETWEFDTETSRVTTRSPANLGGAHRDAEALTISDAVLGVDAATTITLYVRVPNDGSLRRTQPYGIAPDYSPVHYDLSNYIPEVLFDRRHHTIAALPKVTATGQQTTGTLPVVADCLNGQFVAADPGDLVVAHAFSNLTRPFGTRTNAQMAAQFTSCSTQILQSDPYEGWIVAGQSPQIRSYRATEEHHGTATVNVTSETLGIPHGYILHDPIAWGPTVVPTGGTSSTLYLIFDRTTSTSTFFRHPDYSECYTFDEAVALQRLRRVVRPFPKEGERSETGVFDFYLRADHAVVEAQLDPDIRILYADRTHAYFGRAAEGSGDAWDTNRSCEFYRMFLSPQGCGQIERLPDLPSPPFLMFRIPWEDLPTSGSGHQ